ncbi:MAG: ABC transporter substrate-binding protein [Dehalococcoidia bacterium]
MLDQRKWLIAIVLAMAAIVAACGGGDDDEDTAGTQATPGASGQAAATQTSNIKRGGTLVAALGNNPKTFDPMLSNDVASSAVQVSIIEGLYKYDKDFKPVPWLAEKVDISPDNMEYTFHMRQGVMFHDGTEMDAEAVKFSMERVKNNPASVRNADAKTITEIAVLDKYTVKVSLSEPFAPFPSRLTGGLGAVVSPKAVQEMGDEKFGLSPVGTGPFKFDNWQNDVSVQVEKFDNYWKDGADGKKLPYLDGVEWRIITEPAGRLTAIQAGDVDIFADNTRPRDADLSTIKADSNLKLDIGPGLGWSGLWLTINKPPFDNKALRQAVAYAIDRQEINTAIYEGQRTIANGPIPVPLSWAVDPNFKFYPEKADLAKAKEKLAEGGKPNGFEFEYWISAGDQLGQSLAELIQSQLAKVGITMNVQAADFNGVVIPKLMKQESNAYQLGLTGGVDPDQHVGNAFATGAGFNFFPYSVPRVDELVKQGKAVSDIEQRATVYKELAKIIVEDAPYIWHTYSNDYVVANKKVQGTYLGQKATAGYSEFWIQ